MLMAKPEYIPSRKERLHPVMDAPVRMSDGTTMPASVLSKRFFESDFGVSMLTQPYRYDGHFGYDREDMIDDNGLDHCPIGHQRELPYHFGKLYEVECERETVFSSLSDEEIGLLALTMFKHDNGESTHDELVTLGFETVGDIPAGGKTATDRMNEAAIRRYFDSTFLADVHPETLERMEAIISHEDDSLLHDFFEAAHAVQTFETANRAWHRLNDEVWYKNGETIDVSYDADESARLSGLLGISRVVYHQSFRSLQAFDHFGYVARIADETRSLREPKHVLLG
jgi:hypothetical protein